MNQAQAEDPVTSDGFLDNAFRVLQPASGGHRAGLDAVLLAATVPTGSVGRLVDLGAGSGVAGLASAQRCQQLSVDLVEYDEHMACLGRDTLNLPENAHLAPRATILQTDITLKGARRIKAGLNDNVYDFVITNPPFNDGTMRVSPYGLRQKAHEMPTGLWDQWLATASAIARPKAMFAMILRPANFQQGLDAIGNRFGSLRVLPIHAKAGDPANRLILAGVKGGRAPLQFLPNLSIHAPDGAFTEEAEAIFRGQAVLPLW